MEEWRAVKDFEGLYEVSNAGNVRSLPVGRRTGKLLKMSSKTGYNYISLCKNGGSRSVLVHRLIAQSFITNMDGLPYVNHKDLNKTNNTVDNLEWITPLGNAHHARDAGVRFGYPKRKFCIRGHEKTDENSYFFQGRRSMQRTCKICSKTILNAEYYRKRRERKRKEGVG